MNTYLEQVQRQLAGARMRNPVLVTSSRCPQLGKHIESLLPGVEKAQAGLTNFMGRDVVLVHRGEDGWEDALELICQHCPGRLFVIAPELPRAEALKLEWVADFVVVGRETYEYEVHELGLSA